jgi:hypothetical protein
MPPYLPINVVLQTGNGVNLVSWNSVIGATSYTIQRSPDGVNWTTIGTSASNTYVDSTAIVGTLYYYQVGSANVAFPSPTAFTASYPPSITPCLPGQISLGYLRYLTQLRADKLNSQYLTLDEWNSNINQSVYELYDILITKFGDDYFFAPPLLIPLSGSNTYPLPDGSNYPVNGVNSPALYKLNGIDVNTGGGTTGPNAVWVPLSRFNWSDRDQFTTFPGQTGSITALQQMMYRPMGSQLQIFPASQNQTIRMWYVPVMTQLLQDTDMLAFSLSGWSEYVIVDAAMKAMIKEESLEKWNALAASKAALMERIETTAANRDVGQANTVSNTRNTLGDPGFGGFGNGFGGNGWWGGGFGGF